MTDTGRIPTRREFAEALQEMVDSMDESSVLVAPAERIARYLDAMYAALVPPVSPAIEWEECRRCDGCGWYEGGKALQTGCEECGGTGRKAVSDA